MKFLTIAEKSGNCGLDSMTFFCAHLMKQLKSSRMYDEFQDLKRCRPTKSYYEEDAVEGLHFPQIRNI